MTAFNPMMRPASYGVKYRPPPVPHPRAPRPYDPFAPLTQQQIQTNAQTNINAQITPVLKQITDAINQRSQYGSQAITTYTKQLIGMLDPAAANVKSIYADAEASQQALDSSLQQTLSGGGNADAQALTAELQKAGQDTSSVQQVASAGQSAGDTRYALGSASLSQLIAQGAHAGEYMQKLPGIEAATGAQTLRDFQGQLNNELANQTGQIRSQVPGMIQSYLTDAQNREYQKALARSSGLASSQNTAYKQWLDQQRLGLERQRVNNQASQFTARQQAVLARQDARVQARQQQAAQKGVAARGKAFDQGRTQAYAKARTLYGSAPAATGKTGGFAPPGASKQTPPRQAYQYLWATYGKHLMRYTAPAGRPAWQKRVDAMIRTAMMTAGYNAAQIPTAPPVY